jgi:hypothetical protein
VIEELTVTLLVKELPVFMEYEDPLPGLDDFQFIFCSLRCIIGSAESTPQPFFHDLLLIPDESGLHHIFLKAVFTIFIFACLSQIFRPKTFQSISLLHQMKTMSPSPLQSVKESLLWIYQFISVRCLQLLGAETDICLSSIHHVTLQ